MDIVALALVHNSRYNEFFDFFGLLDMLNSSLCSQFFLLCGIVREEVCNVYFYWEDYSPISTEHTGTHEGRAEGFTRCECEIRSLVRGYKIFLCDDRSG